MKKLERVSEDKSLSQAISISLSLSLSLSLPWLRREWESCREAGERQSEGGEIDRLYSKKESDRKESEGAFDRRLRKRDGEENEGAIENGARERERLGREQERKSNREERERERAVKICRIFFLFSALADPDLISENTFIHTPSPAQNLSLNHGTNRA